MPASEGQPDAWLVTSNYQARGFKVIVSIDDRSGKVFHARTLGRNARTWESGD